MGSKNKNPYREGCAYYKVFAFIRNHHVVTRAQLLEAGFTASDITVVLSPRLEGESTRGGDCRGNMSARGETYYMEKIAKKEVGEAQRFRLRYREIPLEKHTRKFNKIVVPEKRPVGRPKTIKTEVVAEKRKVGRPKTVNAEVVHEKRPVGRPKTIKPEVVVKRKVGRPKTVNKEVEAVKRKVGRPKTVMTDEVAEKRKVGRPKTALVAADGVSNEAVREPSVNAGVVADVL